MVLRLYRSAVLPFYRSTVVPYHSTILPFYRYSFYRRSIPGRRSIPVRGSTIIIVVIQNRAGDQPGALAGLSHRRSNAAGGHDAAGSVKTIPHEYDEHRYPALCMRPLLLLGPCIRADACIQVVTVVVEVMLLLLLLLLLLQLLLLLRLLLLLLLQLLLLLLLLRCCCCR